MDGLQADGLLRARLKLASGIARHGGTRLNAVATARLASCDAGVDLSGSGVPELAELWSPSTQRQHEVQNPK